MQKLKATVLVFITACQSVLAAADINSVEPRILDVLGINSLPQSNPGLSGKNIRFGIVSRSYEYDAQNDTHDFGPDFFHKCLLNSSFTLHDYPNYLAGISPHATAVCSVLFGADSDAFNPDLGNFKYHGLVPDANAEIFEFRYFVREHIFKNVSPAVDLLSISLGSQFDDWWTRGIAHLAQKYDLPVIAGIGNGISSSDGTLYPAACDNVLAVGVVDCVNAPNLIKRLEAITAPSPDHTSRGPSPAGICKPDILAPSNFVAAASGTQDYFETGNWSSFATPVVSGIVALILEEAASDPNYLQIFESRLCSIRAIIMNSAQKLPSWHKGSINPDDDHFVPLDYLQGAGLIDAAAAFAQLRAGYQEAGEVRNSGWSAGQVNLALQENKAFYFKPAPGTRKITATLVWERFYKDYYPFEPDVLKNGDLALELWAGGPDGQGLKLADNSDSPVDNVEHICFDHNPAYTSYVLLVKTGSQNTSSAAFKFALAWR